METQDVRKPGTEQTPSRAVARGAQSTIEEPIQADPTG